MQLHKVLLWLMVGLITLAAALCSAQDSTKTLYYAQEQNGVRCGFSIVHIASVTVDGREAVYLVDSNEIHVSAMGAKVDAVYKFTYHIDPTTGQCFHHTSDIDQGTLRMGSDMTVLGDTIRIIGSPEPDTQVVIIDGGVILGNTRIFYHLFNDFVRDTITEKQYRVFSEIDAAVHEELCTRIGAEDLELAGRSYSTVVLHVFDKTIGVKADIWIDTENGYMLRGTFPNRVVYLSDSTVTDSMGVGDLDNSLFATVGVQIPSIKDISYMKVRAAMNPGGVWLTPESLNVRGQSFVGTVVDNNVEGIFEITHERYDGSGAPAFPIDYSVDTTLTEFLEPEDLIQSDDPAIIKKAHELTEGAADSWEAMKRLSQWVSDEIAYDIPGGGTASKTYELRRGECGSHSRLLTAFCRAVGIPARMVWGCMYVPNLGGSFGQHAWTEVYMGDKGWLPVDATAEEIDYVDCSHIRIGIGRSKAIMLNHRDMELLDFTCGSVTMATLASETTETGIPEMYQPYVGKYNAPMGVATVLVQNGSLAIDIPNRMVFELNDADVQIGAGKYLIGMGGLHSSETKQFLRADAGRMLVDLDVASYYPSIMLNQGMSPAGMGDEFLKVYRRLVERRIKAKRAGNKTEADTLKIVVNSTFGLTGSKYSTLYSPELLIQTTITGQLFLLMLIDRMERAGIQIVSANTDGIVCYLNRDREEDLKFEAFADDVRRSRRVRAIAIVLMGLDFSVEVKGDRVDARLQKYDSPIIQEKLDLIGRLLIFTRQMDMLMTSEAGVEAVAQNFLQGNYSLDMGAIAGPGPETAPGSPAPGDASDRRAGK